MDGAITRSAEEMFRKELHELVWQTPLRQLGPQLGSDGPGLASLCRKRRVPTPPLGYWQKEAVGQTPPVTPLHASAEPPATTLATRAATPTRLRTKQPEVSPIEPSEAKPTPEVSLAVDEDDGLVSTRSFHPMVREWVAK